ncbi:MAG: Tetratricopeptide repeat protein [Candidatus Poribacteria bacterium]|nr:Tetratricopeptide repeat protein [Candidatus Poribacteria bacterium]
MQIKKAVTIVLMASSCLIIVLSFFGVFLCRECLSSDKDMVKIVDLISKNDYPRAITLLETLVSKTTDAQTKDRYAYMIATCYRKQGQWGKAISHYQQVAKDKDSTFKEISSYRIAKYYQEMKNFPSAIEEYEALLKNYPKSICAVEAQYQVAECYYNLKKYDEAIDNYKKFAEKYPQGSRSRMALYRVGYVYQEAQRFQDAYVQYQKLIRQYTDSFHARSSLDRIKLLLASDSGIKVTREDNLYKGLVLFYAKQYKDAREALSKVINGADDLSVKSAYFIAQSYQNEGAYTSAQNEYESLIKLYPKSEYAIDSQYWLAQCIWKSGRPDIAIVELVKFADNYPKSDLADDAEFQIAELYKEVGQYSKAVDAYGEIASKYPDGDFADDSMWNMGWCYRKLNKKDKSAMVFQRLASQYPNSKSAGSARFWAGMDYEDAGMIQESVSAYKEAMKSKEKYYSDRARKRIESLIKEGKADKDTALIQYKKVEFDETHPVMEIIRQYTPIWVQVSLNYGIVDDANEVYMSADEAGIAQEAAYYNLSICYERIRDYRKSWAYNWRLLQLPSVKDKNRALPKQIYMRAYPAVYMDLVFNNAKANKVDPYLVSAVILEESRYDAKAVSRSNAQGLMQIMPGTGDMVAKQISIKDFKTDKLSEPETNIKIGAWYLSNLINSFTTRTQNYYAQKGKKELDCSDIAVILSLGGYNAGPTRIKNWMEEYGIDDIDEFVESIPMQEPKNYIKKVLDSYEMYKSLYN